MPEREEVAKLNIFDGLSSEELDSILVRSQEKTFKGGEVIFQESSIGSDLFVVLEGIVSVEIETTHFHYGREQKKLAILTPGDVFGEVAFLENNHRHACVTTLAETRVLQVDGTKLYDLFNKDNHLGYLMMRNLAIVLAQRLIDTTLKWRDNV